MSFCLRRAVFVHVPKTGGTWVRQVLQAAGLVIGQAGRDHATPAELFRLDHPLVTSAPLLFAFVRHPLAWYQSYWCYRMKHGWHRPSPGDADAPIRTVTLDAHCRADDFPTFVANCLERYPQGWVSYLYERYTTGCAFVGRQERLAEDLTHALLLSGARLSRKVIAAVRTTPPANVASGDVEWLPRCQYPADLRERVLAAEQHALKTWGY